MALHLSNILKNKSRLDITIVEKGFAKSRQRAKAVIMAGKVLDLLDSKIAEGKREQELQEEKES